LRSATACVMNNGAYTLSTALLHSLLAKERSLGIPIGFAQGPGLVSTQDRDREAKWICSVGRHLQFGFNTVGLAIGLMDRLLSAVRVQAKYLNCLAVTSLYVAVKFYEEHSGEELEFDPMEASGFLSQLGLNYSVQEVTRMERTLLQRLDWNLLLPTFDRFLESMLAVTGLPQLANSAILRDKFEAIVCYWPLSGNFRPSVLALSLLSLMFRKTAVNEEHQRIIQSLQCIFQVEEEELNECLRATANFLGSVPTDQKENATLRSATDNETTNKTRKRLRRVLGMDNEQDSPTTPTSPNINQQD
jgi:hypothetical protein